MRFLRSRVLVLAAACVLAAAAGILWESVPGIFDAGSASLNVKSAIADEGELDFPETDVDLGRVNGPLQHVVEFTNRSDRVVHIGKIRTSCNCTTTQPDKLVLEPGEKSKVVLSVQPRTDRVSRSRHSIIIEYQGAEAREARLQIHYETRPDLVVPNEIAIRSTGGEDATTQFTLVDYRDKPLKVEEISTSSPNLRARVTEEPSSWLPGWQYRLEAVYTGANHPAGDYSETISLRTTDMDHETITVRTAIHQVQRVRVFPETLQLKTAPDASEVVGTIYLDGTEGGETRIDAATPSDAKLQCTVKANDPTRQMIEVRIPKEDLAGLTHPVSIRITLKKPSTEVVCVQVLP